MIVKETNKLVGIVSYNYEGLAEVCSLISAHRDFIDNPFVGVEKDNSYKHISYKFL